MNCVRLVVALAVLSFSVVALGAADIRVGYVGTDTSHVIAFTGMLNDPNAHGYVPGARVVAAYTGGSPDIQKSASRVDKFSGELAAKWGVEIVPDIPTLCSKVDAVMIMSIDGRSHLEQARQVIAAGKPFYVDKPLAANLEEALAIAHLAKEAGVPWFSTSSLRYSQLAASHSFPDAAGYIVWGPGPEEEHHPMDMAWYGVHSVDLLYALMGPGCRDLVRTYTAGADVTSCIWTDGRIGTIRLNRPYSEFGVVAFRPKEVVRSAPSPDTGYAELVREVVRFFQTRTPPVSPRETLEVFAFMEAAQRSKRAGGQTVNLVVPEF